MNEILVWIARGQDQSRDQGSLRHYRSMHGAVEFLEKGNGYGDSELGSGNGWGSSLDSLSRALPSSKGSWFLLLCTDTNDLGAAAINIVRRMQP